MNQENRMGELDIPLLITKVRTLTDIVKEYEAAVRELNATIKAADKFMRESSVYETRIIAILLAALVVVACVNPAILALFR